MVKVETKTEIKNLYEKEELKTPAEEGLQNRRKGRKW